MSATHLVGTRLPEGDDFEAWIDDGRLRFTPVAGAEDLVPSGGFVLPGLVDAHSHPTMDFSERGLRGGSAELVAANLLDHLRSGELLVREIGSVVDAWTLPQGAAVPRYQRAGQILAPAGKYFDITESTTEPEEAVAVAIAQADAGVDWVKLIMDWPGARGLALNYPPEILAEVVRVVHERGARVGVHAVSREAISVGVAAGVDSVEHGSFADESDLQLMAERNIALVPTLAFLEGFAVRSAGTLLGDTVAASLENAPFALRTALRLGVPVLAGTDALPFGSVPLEVAALQRHGMEPAAALAAATTTARAFLGEPALDEGAPADLVVYREDPRNDPEVLSRPEAVVFGGERIR